MISSASLSTFEAVCLLRYLCFSLWHSLFALNFYFLPVFLSLHFKVFFNYAWSRAFLFANDLPYIPYRQRQNCVFVSVSVYKQLSHKLTHTRAQHKHKRIVRPAHTHTHARSYTHIHSHISSSRQPQRRYLLNSLFFFRVAFASFANFPHLLLFNCTEINANWN